ncbi:MAG: hypothetical protein IKU82_06200, partial [Clostridia bacterium]|nr:hypothetical protein [Clostridia bacterium]
MKKLFMKGKSVLACIVVAAILATSLFTGVVVNAQTGATCGGTIIEKWDQYENGQYVGWYNTNISGEGTEESPFIIDSAEKLAQLCRYGCEANVYYKVDDSIKAFDMNTVAGVDLTVDNITAAEVKTAVADKILGKVWFCDAPFKGNFDGNGVTIYGLCTGPNYYNDYSYENNLKAGHNRGGLFGKIDAKTAVIKNVAIKNSYLKGDPAGAIFGETLGNGGSAIIENIIVANCYVDSTGGYVSGVVAGYCPYDSTTNIADKVKLNNCLVYDNVVYNKDGAAARLIGSMEAYCDDGNGAKTHDVEGFNVKNTVAIGSNIENANWWQKQSRMYENCYTTENPDPVNTTITKIANADAAKGTAAITNLAGLDKTAWFFNTTGYPEPRAFHDITMVDNGDGTHSETCTCGLTSGAIAHTFVEGVCACGAKTPCGEGIVEVWDGKDENGTWITWQYSTFEGSGTEEDPYIVRYAEQLAYLTTSGSSTYASTVDKYYKVDDSVKAFDMNTTGLDLSGDMTTAEVKEMLADEIVNRTYWAASTFAGTFDGNGVEIYGLHAGSVTYAAGDTTGESGGQMPALFPKVTAGTTIKNLTLKNSYLSTTNAYAGGLIAEVTADAGNNAETVTIENCIVHDCYIANEQTGQYAVAPGVIAGNVGSNAYMIISNVLVYGNEVSNLADKPVAILGNAAKCYIPEGATLNTTKNRLINSIILDAAPYTAAGSWWFKACDNGIFQNVYFDDTTDINGFGNYGHANSKLVQLSSKEDAFGAAAAENMPELDTSIWFVTTTTYPQLKAFHDDEFKGTATSENALVHISGACSCGLECVEAHNFVCDDDVAEWDSYYCEVCGYVCEHVSEEEGITEYEGDCITAAGYEYNCPICGYHEEDFAEVAGHNFTFNEAQYGADCQTAGTIAHNYCDVCDKNYAEDASDTEPFENALTDLTGEKAPCAPVVDAETEDVIFEYDNETHWAKCATCGETMYPGGHTGEKKDNGDGTHSVTCSICDYESESEEHNFVTNDEVPGWDSYHCEICGLVCEHVSEEEGITEYEGDCVTAAGYEYNCPICGYHEEDFAEVAGHNFTYNDAKAGEDCETAGTIAHNHCDVCDKNYAADASETEPFENAITDLTGDFGDCIAATDEEGNVIYYSDKEYHWTICAVCGEIITTTAHDLDEGQCDICGAVKIVVAEIAVDATGAYTIIPADVADYDMATDVVVYDQAGNVVVYSEDLGGFALVKGVNYLAVFAEDLDLPVDV